MESDCTLHMKEQETTPYEECTQCEDETVLFNGKKTVWDQNNFFTYWVDPDVAQEKYKDLIENETLTLMSEDEEEDYIDHAKMQIEYFNDGEQYQAMMEALPFMKKFYQFKFFWAWSMNENSGTYSDAVSEDDIFKWAGLDPKDLIRELP